MSLDGRGLGPGEPGAELALAPAEVAVAPPQTGVRQRFLRAGWEFLHDLSVAVLFCFFLIAFVAQAFRVQGTSMEPLLLDGERIVVNKFVYRFRPIERGDVVVFWFPRDPSLSFVKRVVALPGDLVEIRGGELVVNGLAVKEPYLPAGFRDDGLSHVALEVHVNNPGARQLYESSGFRTVRTWHRFRRPSRGRSPGHAGWAGGGLNS